VKLQRTIHPEVRTLDERAGIVEYIASDETLDHYREVIKADGWKFDFFEKNAPFLDSHSSDSITSLLGRVIDFRIENRRLVETVQWALDAGDDNPLIRFGWKMTSGGFLKAVSVGFFPVKAISRHENSGRDVQRVAAEMGIAKDRADKIDRIFLEQQQIELSACVIGANPAALAKSFKAGIFNECEVDEYSLLLAERSAKISSANTQAKPDLGASNDVAAPSVIGRHQPALQRENQQRDFLKEFTRILNQI
jgi:hypothetical protein